MDFIKDFENEVKGILKTYSVKVDEDLGMQKLLAKYFRTINRTICAKPRKVIISDKIKNIGIDQSYLDIIEEIKTKFERGEDINSYLSDHIFNEDYNDYLLDEWGIHYINLSNKKSNPSDFFFDKSPYALFIKVYEDKVYFVDVQQHNSDYDFNRKELLETLDRNWNKILEPFKVKGINEVNHKLNDKERELLRKAGVPTMYEVNGKCYIPSSKSKDSNKELNYTAKADRLLILVKSIEEDIKDKSLKIKEKLKNEEGYTDDNLEFKLFMNNNNFVIREINTGFEVNYKAHY